MRNYSPFACTVILASVFSLSPAIIAAQIPQQTSPPPPAPTSPSDTSAQTPTQTKPQAQTGCPPSTTQGNAADNNNSSSNTNTSTNTNCDTGEKTPKPAVTKKSSDGTVPAATPVEQSKTVHPKNSKEDVEAIGNRNVGKGVNFYSIEHEIALGKGLAQEVERSSKLIDDPVIVEYVNRVGQNLVRNSDAQVPFTIKVIDSDEVNAFALPGGFFFVNSGLILRAQEESELAGVMAHEISHVTARHGTKQATKGEIMQLASIPLILLGPGGWAGYGIYEALQLAIPLSYLKFSRDSEKEADFLGIQYMYKAGYDPNAYVTFFERIQADEKRRPGTIPKFFSTHPPTPDRIEAAQKEIARILPEKDEYIVTTSEFDQVKGRLRNVMFSRKVADNGPGKPTLKTKTEQSDKNKGTTTQDPSSTDDDRPTLKRRPDTE
jgi:beta-barrel assembly-enhancing protease